VREVAARKLLADGKPGTTLTVAYVVWPDLFVLNIGDSRCYLRRDGRLHQLTRDHTLAQEMADASDGDSPVDSSSPLAHMLSRCVGGGESSGEPDLWRVRLQADDLVLLCSDGLTRHVPDSAIAEHIAVGDAGICCAKLIDAANEHGGHDNITVAIAKFGSPKSDSKRSG
jgi:protein phosphatase